MVRSVRVAIIAVVVALVAGVFAPSAFGFGWGPGGGGSPNPSGGQSQGQRGNAQQATVRNCSLYATASNFGMSCITGAGLGHVKTVKEILAGDPAPTCWDEPIPNDVLVSKYEYTPNPDAPYYLHTCISGLDQNNSLYDQPDLLITQQEVIEIAAGAPNCKTPFTDAMKTTCVMSLTANQRVIVSAVRQRDGQIPGIVMTTQPSTTVRTNEDVAYVDAATDANGQRITRTPDYQVGGVTMWAEMTLPSGKPGFTIHPYGQTGRSIDCAGTEVVGPQDTRQTKPDACWWKYPTSSAGRTGFDDAADVYPFRAEADWTVYYNDGNGTHTLATFEKYDDINLPVYDIQTLVVP